MIYLGVGEDGRDHYTTKAMFKMENDIQKISEKLHSQKHSKITRKVIAKHIAQYQETSKKILTEEQLKAVDYILQPNKMDCLIGKAGTGKSFLLGAAKEVWEKTGHRVLGVALSGIAADNLRKSTGIESRTIESF